jgi:hypothetical protein
MMVSDYYVAREARRLLDLHGDDAVEFARARVGELQAQGERFRADTWLRIIIAVEQLQRERQAASTCG